jgi:hypothetical protein
MFGTLARLYLRPAYIGRSSLFDHLLLGYIAISYYRLFSSCVFFVHASSTQSFITIFFGFQRLDDAFLHTHYMTDFYGAFDFFTGPDPTEGFVQYVNEATARQTNLINSSTSAISWGVDTQNQTPEGRPSIRIESKKTYDSGLIVVDVAHMPFGCGTWPA